MPTAPTSATEAVLDALDRAVDEVVGLDVDTLDESEVGRLLAGDERALRRLQAHQSRLAAILTRRRAEQARAQRPGDLRAAQRAARQVRGELTDTLGIPPAQAKRVTRTGRQVQDLPSTAAAHADGRLTDQHVNVIAEVTAHLTGDDRLAFEAELVALADRCRDAVVFGRRARELLIERDHDAAMADLRRKKARRSGRVTQTPEGTTLLRLETAGYEGELVHTVVDAFRTPDAADQHRTAEQRTHDAILAAFETALRTGAASTQHGVRPQVAVIVRAESVRDGDGAARTPWTGPLPYAEVARVMGDSALTRIVANATDLPLAVSKKVRTVPAALWTALVDRDGGCIWPGCDAPAGWCQVAHLETAYVDDGQLSRDNAGLLCTAGPNHHATYDTLGHGVRWVEGRPEILRPDGTPLADPRDSRPDVRGQHLRPVADPTPPDGPPTTPPLFASEDPGPYRAGRHRAERHGATARRTGRPPPPRRSPRPTRAPPGSHPARTRAGPDLFDPGLSDPGLSDPYLSDPGVSGPGA